MKPLVRKKIIIRICLYRQEDACVCQVDDKINYFLSYCKEKNAINKDVTNDEITKKWDQLHRCIFFKHQSL